MKTRIPVALAAMVVSAFLLAGCATNLSMVPGSAGTSTPDPVDLSDAEVVAALCGDEAAAIYSYVETASEAKPNSGQRNVLTTQWGLDKKTVKNDEELAAALAPLKVRAETPCEDIPDDGTVGTEGADGVVVMPVVNGTAGTTVVVDSTAAASTPPLLDGSLKFTAQTLSWAGLVERVGNQQWYIDGLNARAAQTGFTWDDVLKFAKTNRVVDGKVQGVNALAIQIFNLPGVTAAEAQDAVREYITPEVEKIIGVTVEELPIQYIDSGFVNTRNVGTAAFPKMGDFFDAQEMIRVSLMPLAYNESGEAVGLEGSRGAGIFIDCGNLHWVPKAMWVCKDASCEKPPPPPKPKPECPNCLNPKGNNTPHNDGWIPLGPGELTYDNQGTQRQRDAGQTSGNVVDNKVPSGTKSGDTTPDLPKGTVTAPGATTGGDNTADDVVQDNSNQDNGGTQGDGCITDPDTGEQVCG